jgi:hypothetical protein
MRWQPRRAPRRRSSLQDIRLQAKGLSLREPWRSLYQTLLSPTFNFIICAALPDSSVTPPHCTGLDVFAADQTQFQSLWSNPQQDDDCRQWLCAPGDGRGLSPCQVSSIFETILVVADDSLEVPKSSPGLERRKGLTLPLRTNGHFFPSWHSQMVPMCMQTSDLSASSFHTQS